MKTILFIYIMKLKKIQIKLKYEKNIIYKFKKIKN